MSTPDTRTAIVVLVPELEDAVGRFREKMDVSASWGVPAHITILYPFAPPTELFPSVIEEVADLAALVAPLTVSFSEIRWFGDDVMWLAPEPAAPFIQFTHAVMERFPQYPLDGVGHPEVVPHLTVGTVPRTSVEELDQAGVEIKWLLPLTAHLDRAVILAGSDEPNSWHVVAELPFRAHQF